MPSRMFDVAQTISRAAKNDTISQTDGSISGGGGGGVTALNYDSNGVLFNNSLVDSSALSSGDLRYIEHTDTLVIWNDSDGKWWKADIGTAPLSNEGILTYGASEYSISGSTTFSTNTVGFSTFTVAGKAMVVDIEMWGGGGGSNVHSYNGYGAAGGYTKARLTLQPDTYALLVGGGGHAGNQAVGAGTRAFPDGGKNTDPSRTDGGGGGGGSTRLGLQTSNGVALGDSSTYDTTASFNNSNYNGYIAIAGGGAGATRYSSSDNSANTAVDYGVGGGLIGGDGSLYWSADGADALGHGGTQSAGGAAGSTGRYDVSATAGQKYSGGNGAAGGGGGYYGGGGSYGYYAQAGGGSGYLDSNYCVAGQPNYTVINGGQTNTTFDDTIVSHSTYTTAGEGGHTSAEAGQAGAFKLTVIS